MGTQIGIEEVKGDLRASRRCKGARGLRTHARGNGEHERDAKRFGESHQTPPQ
jgi:hypothetical protein